jgi:hypothetical protein
MPRRSLLGVSSVTLLLGLAAAPSRSASPDPSARATEPSAIDVTPRAVRLRMEIEVQQPTPESGPGNTEDEIYYALAWQEPGETLAHRTVRAAGAEPWSMGHRSARRLERLLFEGEVGPLHPARFGVAILEEEAVPTRNELGDADLEAFDDDLARTLLRASSGPFAIGEHEKVAALQVTIKAGRLHVIPSAFAQVRVLEPDFVALRARRGAMEYEIRLFLEPGTGPRATTAELVAAQTDECSAVEERVAAAGPVRAGELRVLPLADRELAELCGEGTDERSRWLEIGRHEDDEIVWRCLGRATPAPDIAW